MTTMPNRSRPSSKSCAMRASSRRSHARCSLRRTRTFRACNTSRRICSSCSSATTLSLRRGTTRSPISQTRSRRVAQCRRAHFRRRKHGMPLRPSATSDSRTGRRTGSPRGSAAPSRTPGRRCPTIFYPYDLVTVFQVGWTVLHDNVVMHVAGQLLDVLATLRCDDAEIQSGLEALRISLTKHRRAGAPWRAGDALEIITSLDMPAWAALVGLLNECPVMHAGVRAVRSARMRSARLTSSSSPRTVRSHRSTSSCDCSRRPSPLTRRCLCCTCAAEDVRQRVVTLVTRELQHGLGVCLRERHRERPRLRPCRRIVDGDRPFDSIRRRTREALDQTKRRGVRVAVRAAIFVVGGLDDERVAIPVAARIAHLELERLRQCALPSSGMTRTS